MTEKQTSLFCERTAPGTQYQSPSREVVGHGMSLTWALIAFPPWLHNPTLSRYSATSTMTDKQTSLFCERTAPGTQYQSPSREVVGHGRSLTWALMTSP